jgi:PAS domain S-box-containing protein
MVGNRSEPYRVAGADGSRYGHLIEHVQDAIVEFELVDGEPIVRGVNHAFVETFGYDAETVRDEPLNDYIVPGWLAEEARALDERTAAGEINYRRVERETATGLREFLYRSIPYDDRSGQTGGFAVYTDLTDIKRQEHRLQVLNRVLRHNLRNNANIILAHTTRLLEQLEEQTEETTAVAATLEKAASDLETLTREAGEIDTILSQSDTTTGAIDCAPLLRAIAEDRRQRAPGATVETALPDSLEVNADANLRAAVDSLVENAIEHHPTGSAHVRIRVSDGGESRWVTIHVEDDCPKIPANELDVVTGREEISPTYHGTGLGLWLVRWTVDAFGGDLSFGTSEFGGNDVRIRLQRA